MIIANQRTADGQNLVPSAFGVFENAAVDVVGVKLDESADVIAELSRFLSSDELLRANKFIFRHHRERYITARANLRMLLGERLKVSPAKVKINQGTYGRPELASVYGSGLFDFNLSHSETLALYAFANDGPVGVDVELVREIPDADGLAERFFSANEFAALQAIPSERRSQAFLACWTRKEAFVKALGIGLSCPLTAFDVNVDPNAPAELIRVEEQISSATSWKIHSFVPYPGYLAAVAHRS